MRSALAAAAAAGALLLPAAAQAHIDVLPTRVEVGQAQEFTIRVPTERPLPTTGVRVLFPPQVTVYAFADPPPGWTIRPLLAPDGRNRGVEYRGGEIGVGRYQDFTVLGTPFEEGETVWRSFQTYADGKVKPWTGPVEAPGQAAPESGPTEPGPAAGVSVVPAGQAATATTAAAVAGDRGGDESGAAIWLGIIAIALAGLALAAAGLLWSTRPARLPADGPEDAPDATEPEPEPEPAAARRRGRR
jgi:uncharacterized protein YcnI